MDYPLPPADDGKQSPSRIITPAQWFAEQYSPLADLYGTAIHELKDQHGIAIVKGVNEDFIAATLGDKGCPEAPTVFIPTEEKFFTYSPNEGIFIHQQEPLLITRLSGLLLNCARACRAGCD